MSENNINISFIEIQFPSGVSYGAKGGACFSTDIITSYSGIEQRNINWNKSKNKYNISLNNRTKNEVEMIIQFFYNVYGKAVGFRFKDWLDYKITNQKIGIGNNNTRTFQLIKTYSIYNSNCNYTREIKKPVKDTIKIYINGIIQEEDEDYEVDYRTGEITFINILQTNDVITADFEFDVPVRFDTDELNISSDDFNCNSWSSINLVEIRL